jgi:hypothetical protein
MITIEVKQIYKNESGMDKAIATQKTIRFLGIKIIRKTVYLPKATEGDSYFFHGI